MRVTFISRYLWALLLLLIFNFATAAPVTGMEEVAQDHLKVMERFIALVATVKDVASAKQAQPELDALNDRNKAIFKKAKDLNISHDTMVEYLKKHYQARSNAVFSGIFEQMQRMSKVPEFNKIGQYISKPVNELSNTTWASGNLGFWNILKGLGT